jgi:hypothetical protein
MMSVPSGLTIEAFVNLEFLYSEDLCFDENLQSEMRASTLTATRYPSSPKCASAAVAGNIADRYFSTWILIQL